MSDLLERLRTLADTTKDYTIDAIATESADELERLTGENKKLAAAAIEKPPYKSDLQARVEELEAKCSAQSESLMISNRVNNNLKKQLDE